MNYEIQNKYKKTINMKLLLSVLVAILINLFIYSTSAFWVIFSLGLLLVFGYVVTSSNINTIRIIVSIMVFQNIILITLINYFSESTINIIILYKECIVYVSIFIFILFKQGLKVILENKWILLFGMIMLVNFILSWQSLFIKSVCARQLMIPVALFLFGISIKIDEGGLYKSVLMIIKLSICTALLGIIEYFFLGDKFWIYLNIGKFMELRGFAEWVFNNLPGDFYSADFINITGGMIRRMVSIFADPLLLSHFQVFSVVVLLFNKNIIKRKEGRYAAILLILLSIIFTFSKGAIMVLGIAMCGYFFYSRNKILFAISTFFSVIIIIYLIKTNLLASISAHSNGLISNFRLSNLFGTGLGTVGNYANVYSENQIDIGHGESFVGTLIGQIGMLGFISFLGIFIAAIKELNYYKQNVNCKIAIVLIVGILIESFLSESAVSFNGSGIYFLFMGLMYRMVLDMKIINRQKIT